MNTTTQAFKAQVTSTFIQGAVSHTTYISAATSEEAARKLEREGYDVEWVKPVQLTHLGGEVV